jgi:hypothetical protein
MKGDWGIKDVARVKYAKQEDLKNKIKFPTPRLELRTKVMITQCSNEQSYWNCKYSIISR